MSAPPEKRYTDEMIEFLRVNSFGRSRKELAEMFNDHFGANKTVVGITQYCKAHGFLTGSDGKFKKGQPALNKGKKMSPEAYAKSAPTMFKKGNKPMNSSPIGTLSKTTTYKGRPGYWKRKVAEPSEWRFEHHLIWEQHNGPIPEGYYVSFADGNHDNLSIDNLILETAAQHAVKISTGVRGYDKETAEIANTLATMRMKVASLTKEQGMKINSQLPTAKRIKMILLLKDMTNVMLAERIQYSYKYVTNMLACHTIIPDEILSEIAKVLDVNIEWLRSGTIGGMKIDLLNMVGGYYE